MRVRILLATVCAVAATVCLSTIVLAERPAPAKLSVAMKNADGARVGTVTFTAASAKGSVDVRANVRGLQPGFHGFHVHAVGSCVGPTFMSAGGHMKAAGQDHAAHSGDLPSLLVKANGTATLRVTTDRFTLADLRDVDGSAVMVHAGPDNFANIPPRYAPAGPDRETLDTGDSGARAACGAIAAPGDQ